MGEQILQKAGRIRQLLIRENVPPIISDYLEIKSENKKNQIY